MVFRIKLYDFFLIALKTAIIILVSIGLVFFTTKLIDAALNQFVFQPIKQDEIVFSQEVREYSQVVKNDRYSSAVKKTIYGKLIVMALSLFLISLTFKLRRELTRITVFIIGSLFFIRSSLELNLMTLLSVNLLINCLAFLCMTLLIVILLQSDKLNNYRLVEKILLSLLLSYSLAWLTFDSLYLFVEPEIKDYQKGIAAIFQEQRSAIIEHRFEAYDALKEPTQQAKIKYDKEHFPIKLFILLCLGSLALISIGFCIAIKPLALGIINAGALLLIMCYWNYLYYRYFDVASDPIYHQLGEYAGFNLVTTIVIPLIISGGVVIMYWFYSKKAQDKEQA